MARKGSGVENRGTSIRLHFVLADGTKVVRTLTSNGRSLKPTPANLAHAERIAYEIRDKVRLGAFSMSEYFEGEVGGTNTVADALDRWLTGLRVAFSTLAGYQSGVKFWKEAVIERRLGREVTLGSMRVADVRYSHIMLALATRPTLTGKTVNNYRSVLSKAFEVLVLDKVLAENPVENTPRAKHQFPLPEPFSLAEARDIIGYMAAKFDAQVHNYTRFAFFSGLRTSELAGLRWDSIDWRTRKALIHEGIVRGRAKDTTKTNRSRYVDLNSESMAALQAQKEHTFLAGQHVFHDPTTGKAWSDERAYRRAYFARTLKALGIRYRRPYNMRHTFATMMLMAGNRPLWVADQMGHDVKVLIDRYARWIPDGHSAAEVSRLESFIGGQAGQEKTGS